MLLNVLYIILLTSSTVILHGLYTFYLANNIRKSRGKHSSGHHELAFSMQLLSELVVCLLLIHFVEAMLWACFYLLCQSVPDFETAVYFSLSSYTTIGYGDVTLPKGLRIVGVVEGLVGTFMCGWSVALLVSMLHNMLGNKTWEADKKK